jgi:hypothetical protein
MVIVGAMRQQQIGLERADLADHARRTSRVGSSAPSGNDQTALLADRRRRRAGFFAANDRNCSGPKVVARRAVGHRNEFHHVPRATVDRRKPPA